MRSRASCSAAAPSCRRNSTSTSWACVLNVREAVGPGPLVYGDWNCGATRLHATRVGRAVADLDIMLEQPCATLDDCAALCSGRAGFSVGLETVGEEEFTVFITARQANRHKGGKAQAEGPIAR